MLGQRVTAQRQSPTAVALDGRCWSSRQSALCPCVSSSHAESVRAAKSPRRKVVQIFPQDQTGVQQAIAIVRRQQ